MKQSSSGIGYDVIGEGNRVLVLLRGLGRWSEHWNGWQRLFGEDFKVITIDNRGVGLSRSVPIRPWHSMSTLAGDVKDVLQSERISKAHILGVSLGGMIALEFARLWPDMTSSVTAINASIGNGPGLRITVSAASLLMRSPVLQDGLYPRLSELLLSHDASQDARSALAKSWLEIDKKYPLPKNAVLNQLIIAAKWNKPKTLKDISAPTHIVLGEGDQFVPKENSLFIRDHIPRSTLTRLNSAGHEIHGERPEELRSAVINFIMTCD